MGNKLVNGCGSNIAMVQDSAVAVFRDRTNKVCFARQGSEDYKIFMRNFEYLGSGYFTVNSTELNRMVGVR